jgi:hypothetical protein
MNEKFTGGNDGNRLEIDVSMRRIYQFVRIYTLSLQKNNIEPENNSASSSDTNNSQISLSNAKKNQLVDQVISEAIAHFSRGAWEEKAQKIAGDLLVALSGEKGRRKVYGTLIQDSRRR